MRQSARHIEIKEKTDHVARVANNYPIDNGVTMLYYTFRRHKMTNDEYDELTLQEQEDYDNQILNAQIDAYIEEAYGTDN